MYCFQKNANIFFKLYSAKFNKKKASNTEKSSTNIKKKEGKTQNS